MAVAFPFEANDVKSMLPGLGRWFRAAELEGYDDAAIVTRMKRRLRKFEDEAQFRILPVQVLGRAVVNDGLYPDTATTAAYPNLDTIIEEGYTFFRQHNQMLMNTTLRQRPILTIQRLRMMFNGQPDTFFYQPPSQWFSWDAKTARFNLIPVANSAAVVAGMAALAVLEAGLAGMNTVPNFLFFDYVAGLPLNWRTQSEWLHLEEALLKFMAYEVLQEVQDAVGAGHSSKSVSGDSASQSWDYNKFAQRRAELKADYTEFLDTFRAHNTPILMDVI